MEPVQLNATNRLELTPEFRSKPIRLTVTANEPFTIEHEMGRAPAGWLVVDSQQVVNIWRSGVMDTNKVELTADQDAEVSIVLL